jgi:hypothetical protein
LLIEFAQGFVFDLPQLERIQGNSRLVEDHTTDLGVALEVTFQIFGVFNTLQERGFELYSR